MQNKKASTIVYIAMSFFRHVVEKKCKKKYFFRISFLESESLNFEALLTLQISFYVMFSSTWPFIHLKCIIFIAQRDFILKMARGKVNVEE